MSAISMMDDDEVRQVDGPEEDGFGCLETALGNLPVKSMDVRVTIAGLVYEAAIRQTYVNRFEDLLEATYLFPLPDRAAVREFRMLVGERAIDGVLKERGEARRDYDEAIVAGHHASIVEEDRPDAFSMRVGNVAPGETVTIEFKLTGPMTFADGEATFRFPLVVAPRYIPGTPLGGGDVGDGIASDTDAVPDASRITPPVLLHGFPSPISLSIEVAIADHVLAPRNVRSSLHAITTSRADGAQLVTIQPGERLNRDFILRFDVAGDQVQSAMAFVRDPEGDEGTFLATVVPPASAQGAALPRDVVFVLDRSGSMDGWKIVAARRALGRMIDTLAPSDRFQVFVFDNQLQKFGDELLAGTNRNRYRTIERLGRVEARGGTEMARPIFEALDLLAGGYDDRRRMVVLVTDGQVGNEDRLVDGVARHQKNVRIHTVGIDRAVNAGFLNRIAGIGGGRSELVESEDRLDEAMDRIHRTIDTPVLTDLEVTLSGVEALAAELVPARPADLFAGAPLLLMGRFRGAGAPVAHLTATQLDGTAWSAKIPGRQGADSALTPIWARQRVRAMEDAYVMRRGGAEALTALSLRFGVLCRFTSWVAVDREGKVESSGEVRRVMQPVEAPSQGPPLTAPAGVVAAAPMMMPAFAPPAPSSPRRSAPEPSEPMDRMEFFSWPPTASMPPQRGGQPRARRGVADGRQTVLELGLIGLALVTGDRDPSALQPDTMADALFEVLRKALAADPADRHASPRELLEDLIGRYGYDTLFGDTSSHEDGRKERPLSSMFGTLPPTAALSVFAWLVATVAFQESEGPATGHDLDPQRVLVDAQRHAIPAIPGRARPQLTELHQFLRSLTRHGASPRPGFWK